MSTIVALFCIMHLLNAPGIMYWLVGTVIVAELVIAVVTN